MLGKKEIRLSRLNNIVLNTNKTLFYVTLPFPLKPEWSIQISLGDTKRRSWTTHSSLWVEHSEFSITRTELAPGTFQFANLFYISLGKRSIYWTVWNVHATNVTNLSQFIILAAYVVCIALSTCHHWVIGFTFFALWPPLFHRHLARACSSFAHTTCDRLKARRRNCS